MKRTAIAAGVLAMVLPVAACGGGGAGSGGDAAEQGQETLTVNAAVIEGTQLFPVHVMNTKGIADKHGLKVNVQRMASVQALYTHLRSPDFQIGFGAWVSVSRFIAGGTDVTNVYSMYGFTNDMLVPKDSSIQSFADLKGKTIGLFGSAAGTTTLMFRLQCIKFFGFDPFKESEIKFLAPGLLASQLEQGGLDAALLLDPIIVNLLETGKFRSVGNLGEIWKKETGTEPLLVAVSMNASWAEENREAARRFVAAFSEALTYIEENPDVWQELAKSVGIESEEGVQLLRERVGGAFINDWSPQFIEAQTNFFNEANQVVGDAAELAPQIPEGTFSREYVPDQGS